LIELKLWQPGFVNSTLKVGTPIPGSKKWRHLLRFASNCLVDYLNDVVKKVVGELFVKWLMVNG